MFWHRFTLDTAAPALPRPRFQEPWLPFMGQQDAKGWGPGVLLVPRVSALLGPVTTLKGSRRLDHTKDQGSEESHLKPETKSQNSRFIHEDS